MKTMCLPLAILILLLNLQFSQATSAQESAVDLAFIPLSPLQLQESGFLLEGGGFIDDETDVAQLIGSITGVTPSTLDLKGHERTYMHRLVLLADTDDPGSELLADEITLIHQFESEESADVVAIALESELGDSAESLRASDIAATYRVVIESTDSLVSVFTQGPLLIEVVSTDLTGRPDLDNHVSSVNLTQLRAKSSLTSPTPDLSAAAIEVNGLKATTFADTPDSHQHYLTRSGTWLPSIGFPARSENASEFGIDEAFESQQLLTLNTGDEITFQTWLATFEDEAAAEEFVATAPLDVLPTSMFADHEQGELAPRAAVSGTNDDGARYSGYREIVFSGDRVAVVAILGSGNLIVNEEQVSAFAETQRECLAARDDVCASISASDIFEIGAGTPPDDSTSEGTYTDPNFEWSVNYGDAGWGLTSVEAGVILELQHGRSLASIEPVVDRHGDPTQCILEEVRLLEEFEEHAYITLGSDVADEPRAGNESGHVWAIYTVEPLAEERADQEYTIRIDCYVLVEGEASLVVHHSAPRDQWESESAKGDALRANIEINGVAAETSNGVDVQVRNVVMLLPRIWIPLAA